MNVATLIDKGNRKLDTTLDNQLWYDYFNDCLMELAPILRLEKKTTIAYIPGTITYNAPTDLIEDNIIMLRLTQANVTLYRLPLDNFTDAGFKVFGGKIELQLPADFDVPANESLTVFYYRTPTLITSNGQVPDIPVQYRQMLVHYGAAKYNQTDEEPENEASYLKDFLALRLQLDTYTRKRTSLKRTLQWEVRRGVNG